MRRTVSLGVLLALSLTATLTQAQTLAFPGAEGYGRHALGGRGGQVLFVTNLNDAGPGSLRAAIETEGPRIVLFQVSGTIELKSDLIIKHPRITIAGQTAPGDGICLRRYTLIVSADDAVVRYLRVRLGDEAGRPVDGIGVRDAENVIVDHCSVSWTLDEAVNTYHGTRNITVQWCLISESLHDTQVRKGHGYAASLGGINTSYHHNLLANNAGRNPSIAGGDMKDPSINLDFRNNVIFNWSHRTLDGRPHSINVVNNYYKTGPASRDLPIVKIQSLHDGTFGKWYIQGNVLEARSGSLRREGLVTIDAESIALESILVDKPADFAPVSTHPAENIEDVLRLAGASRPKRDALDTRIVGEVHSGKTAYGNGIISSQSQVGGWPELLSTPSPIDTDADGLPDAWERRYNPKGDLSLQSSQDLDGDGYTNIEEYLNETDPTGGN
jgi:pectate lyase